MIALGCSQHVSCEDQDSVCAMHDKGVTGKL